MFNFYCPSTCYANNKPFAPWIKNGEIAKEKRNRNSLHRKLRENVSQRQLQSKLQNCEQERIH